jgi:type I site-specific restriction-modification system R (restriction) subunit
MCYLVSARVTFEAAMQNPTLVVLTDRNHLDDQLFGTLARCRDLLAKIQFRRPTGLNCVKS